MDFLLVFLRRGVVTAALFVVIAAASVFCCWEIFEWSVVESVGDDFDCSTELLLGVCGVFHSSGNVVVVVVCRG